LNSGCRCGYSIDAVPKLNALNPDDTESAIQLFVKNYSPQFALLTSAGKAAEQYGVLVTPPCS